MLLSALQSVQLYTLNMWPYIPKWHILSKWSFMTFSCISEQLHSYRFNRKVQTWSSSVDNRLTSQSRSPSAWQLSPSSPKSWHWSPIFGFFASSFITAFGIWASAAQVTDCWYISYICFNLSVFLLSHLDLFFFCIKCLFFKLTFLWTHEFQFKIWTD